MSRKPFDYSCDFPGLFARKWPGNLLSYTVMLYKCVVLESCPF